MATIEQKRARLDVALIKVDELIAAGSNFRTPESNAVGLEFVKAFADFAKEFGHEILKPIKDDFIHFIHHDSGAG